MRPPTEGIAVSLHWWDKPGRLDTSIFELRVYRDGETIDSYSATRLLPDDITRVQFLLDATQTLFPRHFADHVWRAVEPIDSAIASAVLVT